MLSKVACDQVQFRNKICKFFNSPWVSSGGGAQNILLGTMLGEFWDYWPIIRDLTRTIRDHVQTIRLCANCFGIVCSLWPALSCKVISGCWTVPEQYLYCTELNLNDLAHLWPVHWLFTHSIEYPEQFQEQWSCPQVPREILFSENNSFACV